ncbi:hypothetical protein Bca101_097861 [Brassica carinata]
MKKQESNGANSDFESNSNGNVNFKTASTDQSLLTILDDIKSSRCGVCSQIFPAFEELSNNFKGMKFVYADIDECPETTRHIRYTPTFQFYRNGEKVDEMFGTGEERLRDRLWLHS